MRLTRRASARWHRRPLTGLKHHSRHPLRQSAWGSSHPCATLTLSTRCRRPNGQVPRWAHRGHGDRGLCHRVACNIPDEARGRFVEHGNEPERDGQPVHFHVPRQAQLCLQWHRSFRPRDGISGNIACAAARLHCRNRDVRLRDGVSGHLAPSAPSDTRWHGDGEPPHREPFYLPREAPLCEHGHGRGAR